MGLGQSYDNQQSRYSETNKSLMEAFENFDKNLASVSGK